MSESRLEIGDKAPAFKLPDQDGNLVSLASLKGNGVILYFYPAAMTLGCTKEAVDFNAALKTFEKAGYTVIGVSPDAPAKLKKFEKAENLKFKLLGDEDKAVHKAYGAFGKKALYGKLYEGVLRSTFVIDAKGKIELALYNVKATGHVNMLRKQLDI